MATVRIAVITLAALLTLTACSDPGTVVNKTTEGREVTGQHFLWCKRIDGKTITTAKVKDPYDKYVSLEIGDHCP